MNGSTRHQPGRLTKEHYLSIRIQMFEFVHVARIATVLVALARIVAAIALLALFHNFVATEWSIVLLETVLLALAAEHRVEDSGNVVDGTVRKLVVVLPLAASGRRVHDVVAQGSTGTTLRRVVVRRPEIVTNLVGQR